VIRVSKGPSPTPPPNYVNVPTHVGASQSDALDALQGLGLPVEVFNDYSASVPRGHVIGQLPHAGESSPAGAQAVLMVSSGPPTSTTAPVALPIVTGMTEADAAKALRASGLDPQTVQEFSSSVPAGTVIDQFPSAASLAETPAKKSSLLWLWILIAVVVVALLGFLGYRAMHKTALVPSVVGLEQAQADSAITAAGFKVGSVGTTQTTNAADVGKVVAQDPPANAQARPGSPINIVVSGGQKLISVPNVTGMTEADAQSALKAAGLTAQSTSGSSQTVPKGTVISQAPSAGEQVPSGTSVGITVSSGPGNTAVPDVIGQSQSQASDALNAAGLGVKVSTANNSAPQGQVYSQSPAAGTLVAPGTSVTIHVSNGPAPAPTTVTVPNVIGQSKSKATDTLTGLGFQVSVGSVAASGTPSGQVVAQKPSAGAKVQQGYTVSITVAQ